MSEMWTVCSSCQVIAEMTAGDARFIRPEGWTERTVDNRLQIRCPDCLAEP